MQVQVKMFPWSQDTSSQDRLEVAIWKFMHTFVEYYCRLRSFSRSGQPLLLTTVNKCLERRVSMMTSHYPSQRPYYTCKVLLYIYCIMLPYYVKYRYWWPGLHRCQLGRMIMHLHHVQQLRELSQLRIHCSTLHPAPSKLNDEINWLNGKIAPNNHSIIL